MWTGPETLMKPRFQWYHEMLPKRRKMSRRYSRVFILSSLEKLVTRCFSKQRNIQTIWRTKLSHIFNSQIARQCLENIPGTILSWNYPGTFLQTRVSLPVSLCAKAAQLSIVVGRKSINKYLPPQKKTADNARYNLPF